MADVKRLVSAVLLGLGVLLVFLGFTAALGFTPSGMVASVAAIGALLYAGAAWFAPPAPLPPPPHPQPLIVFDRGCRMVTGPAAGQSVVSQFPESARPEIEQRCAAALAGMTVRFPCACDGKSVIFDALPVRTSDGAVVYGILLTTDPVPGGIAATA